MFMIVCDVFLFLAALFCYYENNIQNSKNYYGHYITSGKQLWYGEILELPVEKENFYKVKMEVRSFKNSQPLQGKVLAYFKKPFDKSGLKPGNELTVKSEFIPINAPLNPHEFDYKSFMAKKNIYYSTFVNSENVGPVLNSNRFSLTNSGAEIKQKIIDRFNSVGLDKEAAQLCIALLTGYDDEINPETINAFAHSGTLHVLSVSGLHTGIIYAVLVFILGYIDKNRKHKLLQLIIITLVLWMFVLITGFSPPVLRSAIMLNLIAIGRFYYGYSSLHSLNILAVSAFILLLADPNLICDTGFLLSYFAVAGILLFEPSITGLIDSKYTIVNKTWQMTSVSLAAQLSTLPITLFLFHQFPLWFIISNLVVIPLCIGVMALAFLLLIKLNFLIPLINICSSAIFFTIHLTDHPRTGYIDHIDFNLSDFLFLSVLIIIAALFIKHRHYSYAISSLVLLIGWQLVSIVETGAKKSTAQIVIYHIKKQSAVDIKNKTALNFVGDITSSNYNYHIKNNHTFYNYPDTINSSAGYIRSAGTSFLKISKPAEQVLVQLLKPDYILVTGNAEISDDVLKGAHPKLVVADGSNNYSQVKKLKALCDKFAIQFYSTAQSGFLQINI